MQTISLKRVLLGMLFIFCGMLISINWSQTSGLKMSFVKSAYAVVGRPATPGSVAGVHRRAHRRSHYYNNNYYHNNRYHYNNRYYHNKRYHYNNVY